MKNLEPLTKEDAVAKLNLSKKVADKLEGRNCGIDIAMMALLLDKEISSEQYHEYRRLICPLDYSFQKGLFKYLKPKKDRA
jgi:hypothetical protein